MKPLKSLSLADLKNLLCNVFPDREFRFENFYIGLWFNVLSLILIIDEDPKTVHTISLSHPDIKAWLISHAYDISELTPLEGFAP